MPLRPLPLLTACALALASAACAGDPDVQPLPPERRPSAEARAGLPEMAGVWRFAGFEVRAQDTALVREGTYPLVAPRGLQVSTQRLDSIAGTYVGAAAGAPFVGEVRRDGIVALVAEQEGASRFVAARFVRDTLWVELSSLAESATWSPGARAALVRQTAGAPFLRLLGGAPLPSVLDSIARADSMRRDSAMRADSLRNDSILRATPTAPVTPVAPPPTTPAPTQPRPVTPRPAPATPRPPATPPSEPVRPRPTRPAPRDTLRVPPIQPSPEPVEPREPPREPPPTPAPRETIRFPVPRT